MYAVLIHKDAELVGEVVVGLCEGAGPVLARYIDAGYDLALTVAPDTWNDPNNMNDGPNSDLRVAGRRITEELNAPYRNNGHGPGNAPRSASGAPWSSSPFFTS